MMHLIPQPCKITYFKRECLFDESNIIEKQDSSLGEEEYLLEITFERGITIIGGSGRALFYGRRTLDQIVQNCGKKLPAMRIEDKPYYKYRGFMIDCSRHFFTVDELKVYIDVMASFKFNKFHWHLTDDQGFRMETETLPELTEKGSIRKSSDFGNRHIGKAYSGYYTKAQMKEIVDYCAERYIDVIPELDFPGHTGAMIHAYPALSCRNVPVPVKTTQGIFKDILCAGKEFVYETLFKIIDSMCEIFPYEYYHIGGDEAPKDYWKHCSDCKRVMAENGLENYEQLQCHMMNRVIDYLKTKGKKAICWNDALAGGNLSNTATVQFWMDKKDLTVNWANRGRKVIVSDFYHYYFDYPYGMTPLKKVYKYNPYFSRRLDLRGRESIEGIECCLWTEHIYNFSSLAKNTFPRAFAVAETAWCGPGSDYSGFENRTEFFARKLKAGQINTADKKQWNPNLLSRLVKTAGFFYNIKPRGKTQKR